MVAHQEPSILSAAIATLKERFPDGVDIYLACSCSSDRDWAAGPAFIARKFSADFLSLIETAAVAVAKYGWSEVSLQNGPHDVPEADLAVKYWNLQVCKDYMWFRGVPDEGLEVVESNPAPFEQLTRALGLGEVASLKDPDQMPDGFRWHGGVLVYGAEDAVDALCDVISEAHPEIEARATAARMQVVIEEGIEAPFTSETSNVGRRRLGI